MEGASQVLVLARIKGPGLRAGCLLISGHQGLLGQETGWDVAEGEAWACPCYFRLGPGREPGLGKACFL